MQPPRFAGRHGLPRGRAPRDGRRDPRRPVRGDRPAAPGSGLGQRLQRGDRGGHGAQLDSSRAQCALGPSDHRRIRIDHRHGGARREGGAQAQREVDRLADQHDLI
ncbi:MAG: hypothetical protein ACK559_29575, partial [bacterium]